MKRAALVLVVLCLLSATPAMACYRGYPRNVSLKAAKNVSRVLHHWFGRDAHAAQRVVSCESRFDKRATNGQYKGVLQMGASERRTYGYGRKVWFQVRGAYRYFVATDRTWGPWTCKP